MEAVLNSGSLLALAPLALLALLVTVEVGIGLTIGSMPRNKAAAWTAEHRARVRRVWIGVGLFWPAVLAAAGVTLLAPWPIVAAFWGLVAVLALQGLRLAVRRGRAVRYVHAGRCGGCGYDLRGRHDAATCPECGKTLDAVALKTARQARLA